MLNDMIQKKINELEKEKLKMSIDANRLAEIDAQLKQYRVMLEELRKESDEHTR